MKRAENAKATLCDTYMIWPLPDKVAALNVNIQGIKIVGGKSLLSDGLQPLGHQINNEFRGMLLVY